MKSRTFSLNSIIALFLFLFAVAPAHAQFGGLIKKAKEKTKQVNVGTETNTNAASGTSNSSGYPGSPASEANRHNQAGDEGLRWDLAPRNRNFTDSVDEKKMRRMVEGGRPDYGRGGILVFSNQPVTKPSASLDDSMWTIKSSDNIYMTAFLGEPLDLSFGNALTLEGTIVTVGNQKPAESGYIADTLNTVYRWNKAGGKILPIDFLPAGGKSAKFQSNVGDIAKSLRKLPPGIHMVMVRLYGSDGLGVGAFYYDNRAGQGGGSALDATLKSVTMPAPAMRNPQLEKGIANYLNAMGGSNDTSRLLKVVIVDRGWTQVRNDYGVVIGRAISAVVAIKGSDGVCFRETHSYMENTDGSGLRLEGTRERMDMACENAQR